MNYTVIQNLIGNAMGSSFGVLTGGDATLLGIIAELIFVFLCFRFNIGMSATGIILIVLTFLLAQFGLLPAAAYAVILLAGGIVLSLAIIRVLS